MNKPEEWIKDTFLPFQLNPSITKLLQFFELKKIIK